MEETPLLEPLSPAAQPNLGGEAGVHEGAMFPACVVFLACVGVAVVYAIVMRMVL